MKTLDINAKEWFDRTYGNSYFSARIVVDFGMKAQKEFTVPFQYGYGDYYIQAAMQELQNQRLIPPDETGLWGYCQDNNIILRNSKQERCLKRELDK